MERSPQSWGDDYDSRSRELGWCHGSWDAEDIWDNQAFPVGQAPEDEALPARPHPAAELAYADTASLRLAAAGPQVVLVFYTQAEAEAIGTILNGGNGFQVCIRTVFDLGYFRTFNVPNPYGYKQHNRALKWLRDRSEAAGEDSVAFSNTDGHPVPELVHPKGTEYSFNQMGQWISWRWQEMVAQMDAKSMHTVVEGLPDPEQENIDRSRGLVSEQENIDRSRGFVSCRSQKTDRYDNKRHHALKAERASMTDMLYIWDFVVVRVDGTEVFFHPNYSETKLPSYTGVPLQDYEFPESGLGGTNGRGAFKYFRDKKTEATLRFSVEPKGKGEGKANSTGSSSSTAVAGSVVGTMEMLD